MLHADLAKWPENCEFVRVVIRIEHWNTLVPSSVTLTHGSDEGNLRWWSENVICCNLFLDRPCRCRSAFPAASFSKHVRERKRSSSHILRVHMATVASIIHGNFRFLLSSHLLCRQRSNSPFRELRHRKSLSANWHTTNSSFLFSDWPTRTLLSRINRSSYFSNRHVICIINRFSN